MEQHLLVTGKIKLTRQEVSRAIMDFLKKEKNMDVKKTVYPNQFDGVICNITQELIDSRIPDFPDQKQDEGKRNSTSGWSKKNNGIFAFLKDYMETEKKAGKKAINFNTIFEDVKFQFHSMDEARLKSYLHNKKQLPGIKFQSKRGEVIL